MGSSFIIRTPWPEGELVPEGSEACGLETTEVPWDDHEKRVKKEFVSRRIEGKRRYPRMFRKNCLLRAERDGRSVYSLVSEIIW